MLYHLTSTSDFPGGSVVKNPLANNAGDTGSILGSGRSPGEMATPAPVFLPGKSHGQRSLVGDSPWGHRGLNMTLVTKQQHMQAILFEGAEYLWILASEEGKGKREEVLEPTPNPMVTEG